MIRGRRGSSTSRLSRLGSDSSRGLRGSDTRSSASYDPSHDVFEPISTADSADLEDVVLESNASTVKGRGDNLEPETPAYSSQRTVIGLLVEDPSEFDNVSIGNGVIATLKNMFNGPWTSWKKVPSLARNAMWARFKTQYQWDPTIDGAIYAAWEKVLKKRFPCVVGCARKKAEEAAENGTPPFDGTNIGVLRGYGPTWIGQDYWIKMVECWESPTWKAISSSNKRNRSSRYEGSISKHTSGSISIARHRHIIEKKEKRKISTVELFKVTHTKKGSNGELITPKATYMLSRYNDLVVKKYGEDVTSQPELGDVELWTEAVGGVKKGRIYGFGAPYDPQLVMTGIPSAIRSSEQTLEEVRLLKEELKKRDEELKKRDEQIAEQQRTFEQRCEQRIEQQVQHVAAQMRQMMEQVARFTGAPISLAPSGPFPSGMTTCNTNETTDEASS